MQHNGDGQFITLEGSPSFARIAKETLATLGLDAFASVQVGAFRDTLAGVLARLKPVDYIFIDGHHDELATQEYFKAAIPHRAVLVFDDIVWSPGMRNAWDAIRADPPSLFRSRYPRWASACSAVRSKRAIVWRWVSGLGN